LASALRVVAGLGNPGRSYAATRHNAGFWFADRLAAKLGASFQHEAKFGAEVAKAGDVRIVKPTTFMNLSGRAVGGVARFFGVDAAEVLVAHDELDLLPGDARLKFGGGTAGHNGLRDIQAQLGTPSFWRLRLGIGHPRDSQAPEREVVDYVLKPPSAEDRLAIDEAIDRALDAWRDVAAGDMERAMTLLHTRPRESTPGNAAQ
jgi:PTH1 family peptidyl-tRNA hydrolase